MAGPGRVSSKASLGREDPAHPWDRFLRPGIRNSLQKVLKLLTPSWKTGQRYEGHGSGSRDQE